MRDLNTSAVVGRVKALASDFSIREKGLAVGDAAHLEAFKSGRLKPLTEDEFGTAATNVDNQTRVFIIRQGVRHAEVDQSRFLAPVNDVDRHSQNLLRGLDKIQPILGAAECVSADDPDFGWCRAVNQLFEALEAG